MHLLGFIESATKNLGLPSISLGVMELTESLRNHTASTAMDMVQGVSHGREKESVDSIVQSLLWDSKRQPNKNGYWRGYYDFSPKELREFLSEKELSDLIEAYYNDAQHWSNEDDHSYYHLRTDCMNVIFHNSDIRIRFTQTEINAMEDVERRTYYTLLPKEEETGKRDFWKLSKISIKLY